MRHALTTRAGVAAVVATVALAGIPALFGVAGSSAKSVKPATSAHTAAPQQAHAVASARPRADRVAWPLPFTSFDLFLLVAGGGVLLLFGANVGRPAREGEAAVERVGA